jgi:hypothetical protein
MYRRIALVLVFFACVTPPRARAVEPEVAAITFDSHCAQSTNYPAWVTTVEQTGGQFSDDPPYWTAGAALPVGQGRVSIVIDRTKMNEDLALQIIYQDNADADLVVQLFDANNRALALDLFANVLAVGREARTDTFIVPLRTYPTATRVTLRGFAETSRCLVSRYTRWSGLRKRTMRRCRSWPNCWATRSAPTVHWPSASPNS